MSVGRTWEADAEKEQARDGPEAGGNPEAGGIPEAWRTPGAERDFGDCGTRTLENDLSAERGRLRGNAGLGLQRLRPGHLESQTFDATVAPLASGARPTPS